MELELEDCKMAWGDLTESKSLGKNREFTDEEKMMSHGDIIV